MQRLDCFHEHQDLPFLREMIKELVLSEPFARFQSGQGNFEHFASLMRKLIPDIPLPIATLESAPLAPLMKTLLCFIDETNDPGVVRWTNPWMYRFFEHNRDFDVSRGILKKLAAIYQYEGNRPYEAIAINNLAFQYQLEGRPCEAIPLFEFAARRFREERCDFQYANARANYWMCRFSLNMIDRNKLTSIEKETLKIMEYIGQTGAWFERKPLILLAKIEEIRGNLQNAIHLVQLAIDSGHHCETRYPVIDQKYLNFLRAIEEGSG